jgi:hypothetical protein
LNVRNNYIPSAQITWVLSNIGSYAGLVDNVSFLYSGNTTQTVISLPVPPSIQIPVPPPIINQYYHGNQQHCFLKSTRILTVHSGYKPIESLRKGELVYTADRRIVPIIDLISFEAKNKSEYSPVRIPKNFYDENVPFLDTFVSQNHAVYDYPSKCFKKAGNILKPIQETGETIVYYHIQLPNYETDHVFANGIVTESFRKEETTSQQLIQQFFSEKLSNVGVLNFQLQVLHSHS